MVKACPLFYSSIEALLGAGKQPGPEPITVRTPQDAARLLGPLKHAPEEHFVAIHLNAKHEVIGLHEVSHGTLSTSLVHPREVFKAALVANSFAILVCHNHPSGSTLVPSSEDFATTKQLLQAGKLLGVAVVDHLIIGFSNFTKEAGKIADKKS